MQRALRCFLSLLSAFGAANGFAATESESPVWTLERVVEAALERSERAQISTDQLEMARARRFQALAFFFPTIAATGNYTRRANEVIRELNGVAVPIQQHNALSALGQLRWTLFDARGFPLYAAASAEQRAVEDESREARRRLGFEVASAFLQTLSASNVALAATRREDLAKNNFTEAKLRQAAGLASSSDVTRAELEMASANRETVRAQGAADAAGLNLAWLVNDDRLEHATLEFPQMIFDRSITQAESTIHALASAGDRRPDLNALRMRTQRDKALADEPLARLAPTVSLLGQVRATNEAGFVGRIVDGFVGVDLTWTLFDGGARYGVRNERAAAARIAALNERLAERRVALEVKSALISMNTANAALSQAQVASEMASRNVTEVTELYRQGLTTAMAQADASLQRFLAEVNLITERFTVVASFLELRAALGVDALGRETSP